MPIYRPYMANTSAGTKLEAASSACSVCLELVQFTGRAGPLVQQRLLVLPTLAEVPLTIYPEDFAIPAALRHGRPTPLRLS